MMNVKTTKNALITSSISLLLCFAMLLGTTFAWFTDTVTSANNIIKSGNLDIELDYWNGSEWKTVQGASEILTNSLWEPGVTEVAYLRLHNAGSLALKYQFGVNIITETVGKNVAGDEFKLSDYIYFDVIEGVNGQYNAYASREAARAVATQNTKISAGYSKVADMAAGSPDLYLAMILHMPETVGNEANHNGIDVPNIELGINVAATQMEAELDSFGTNYDNNASYPESELVVKEDNVPATINTSKVSVDIPADAPEGDYALEVSNSFVTVDSTGLTTAYFDINLTRDGVSVNSDGTEFIVTVEVDAGIRANTVKVLHKGVEIQDATVDSDAGTVSFITSSFSPYEVIYQVEPSDLIARTKRLNTNTVFTNPNGTVVLGNGLEIDTSGNSNFGLDLGKINLETAYQFEPTMSATEVKESPYKTWHADFVVYVDKDIPENSIALAGYYDAWCSFNNDKWVALCNDGFSINANEKIRLIEAMGNGGITVSMKDLSDYGNDGIGFLCGALELDDKLPKDTTLTVELRVYEATDGSMESETGHYITVGKYDYTFK